MAITWYATVSDKSVLEDGNPSLVAQNNNGVLTSYDPDAAVAGTPQTGIRSPTGDFIPVDQIVIATTADLQRKGIYLINNTGNASGSMLGVTLSYNAAADQVSGAAV